MNPHENAGAVEILTTETARRLQWTKPNAAIAMNTAKAEGSGIRATSAKLVPIPISSIVP
jgi:hypothetical protein